MIYFDNSATTLFKPQSVAEAVAYGINNFGNAGRSFYEPVLLANREIYLCRLQIANLVGLEEPLNVAFTSSATESLNLVIAGLVNEGDEVVTTVSEHNSVLRPLYLSGCDIKYWDCDDYARFDLAGLSKAVTSKTKYLVYSHGSNVTGNVIDAYSVYEYCKKRGITVIMDVSQTLGAIPVDMDMADAFCFTGHKALFGPTGTGGVIVNGSLDFKIKKTGGAGVNSFDRFQSLEMPDIFESGTLNSPGIYGLSKGVAFINEIGINTIHEKETSLISLLYDGLKDIDIINIYGDFEDMNRLPVLSLNAFDISSAELAMKLWENHEIAVRAGSHCAPLIHKRFDTVDMGMIRLSLSYFNTEWEVKTVISAIREELSL